MVVIPCRSRRKDDDQDIKSYDYIVKGSVLSSRLMEGEGET